MATARAVTDSMGYRTFSGMSIHDGLKTDDVEGKSISIWAADVSEHIEGRLGDILSDTTYSLIANYLVKRGYPPTARCSYGRAPRIREVIIDRVRYRSNSYSIYHDDSDYPMMRE